MKRFIGLAGAFALAVALNAFYCSVATAQPQGAAAQASPSAAETPEPVPQSEVKGPYLGHPFAHPTRIPRPSEQDTPEIQGGAKPATWEPTHSHAAGKRRLGRSQLTAPQLAQVFRLAGSVSRSLRSVIV